MAEDSQADGNLGTILAAAALIAGVVIFLWGGTLVYAEATAQPYTHVATPLEDDVDDVSVVEFEELTVDEQAAFHEMVEREGPGDGYRSDSDEAPIDADAVRYEGEVYDVHLSEVREVGGSMLYLFAGFTLIGGGIAASGAYALRREKAEGKGEG